MIEICIHQRASSFRLMGARKGVGGGRGELKNLGKSNETCDVGMDSLTEFVRFLLWEKSYEDRKSCMDNTQEPGIIGCFVWNKLSWK